MSISSVLVSTKFGGKYLLATTETLPFCYAVVWVMNIESKPKRLQRLAGRPKH